MMMIKKVDFLNSNQIRLNLLTMEKKITQMRHRFVIEVITDTYVGQVKKTFREFQYFNKILQRKLGIQDKQLHLAKHIRSNNDYKDLELYVQRLNMGYLLYKPKKEQVGNPKNAEISSPDYVRVELDPVKTRDLRNYLYDLLFREDELFIDGVDDSPEEDERRESGTKKVQDQEEKTKISRNPLKRLFQSVQDKEKAETQRSSGQKEQQRGQKSSTPNKLKRAILNLANNITKSMPIQQNNLKQILKLITKSWIKFPNNYDKRDRNSIYHPYIWQQYDMKLLDNAIEFINLGQQHRHRKIFVIFQSEVQLNFQHYTKLRIQNKGDKNALQIRLSLHEASPQIIEQYLALYTYIKEILKEQQEKSATSKVLYQVCKKVRIRINLKTILEKSNSDPQVQVPQGQIPQQSPPHGSQIKVNIPHNSKIQPQLQFKEHRQITENLKNITVKIMHSCINISVSVCLDCYVDVDFPIVDNYGALDISVIDISRDAGFLAQLGSKDALYTFHMPVQTVYDYIFNLDMKKKRLADMKGKMIEIKHTKLNLTLDYKFIGNWQSLCKYNTNDIFEQDQPPQQFNRDQLRMNTNRLKRIVWSIQLYMDKLKDIKNFTYPNFSYLVYLLIACACLFFDQNYFVVWALLFLLAVLLYNSPMYGVLIRDFVDFCRIKAQKSRFDSFFMKKNPFVTEIYAIPTKKVVKMQFLDQFILTRKKKRSIYKKYKRILEVLLHGQILLTKFVSMVEKIKNIFLWYHYYKTKLLFCSIAAIVVALIILPVRLILVAAVIKIMLKGSKYHRCIQDINRVIVYELVKIILRENNYPSMAVYFKQHSRALNFQSPECQQFTRSIKQNLSNWLQITIDMQKVTKCSKNMSQFLTNLSKCKTKYQIKKQICQKFGFSWEWSKTESSIQKYLDLFYGFVVTVPSDKYLMGVQTIVGGDDDDVDEDDPENLDRELLSF